MNTSVTHVLLLATLILPVYFIVSVVIKIIVALYQNQSIILSTPFG